MISTSLSGIRSVAFSLPSPETGSSLVLLGDFSDSMRRETVIRVRSALASRGRVPSGTLRLPRDLDSSWDLAVAFSFAPDLAQGFDAAIGELSLDGHVRPVRGILPRLLALRDSGVRRCLVPASQPEAALVPGIEVFGLDRLGGEIRALEPWVWSSPRGPELLDWKPGPGLAETAKKVAEAVANRQNVLLIRNPGAGSTMLARRVIPEMLEEISEEARFEVATIYSAAGLPVTDVLGRPFRAPHYTVSASGLVGGGPHLRPGEVSLAHEGVLFLDEVSEFSRSALRDLADVWKRGAHLGIPAKPRTVLATVEPAFHIRLEPEFVRDLGFVSFNMEAGL